MSLPIKVPDMIRDAATRAGITQTLSAVDPASEDTQFVVQVSQEVKQAHADGDYTIIDQARRQTSNDFNPILENFRQREEGAWVTVTNVSDGVEYLMSIAGPASDPYAYFWQYTYQPEATKATESGDAPNLQPVQQFGSLSVNGKFLGVSFGLWSDKGFEYSLFLISTLLGYAIAKFISGRISSSAAGKSIAAVIAEAIEKTGIKAIAEKLITAQTWALVRNVLKSVVFEAVGGLLVALLIIFIASFIYKEFKVSITVYNWDLNNDYVIDTSPAGYNQKLDGDLDWTAITIPRPTNSIKPPNGFPIPSKDTIYQYAGYVFVNVNKILQGVGAALIVKSASDKSKGFALKYNCPFSGKNTIGLTGGVPSSAQSYYDNASTWQSVGTQTATTKIPGTDVDISCSTPKLQGASDDLYYMDVNIGLKPSGRFGSPPRSPPPNEPLPQPRLPGLPAVGSKIKAPDGQELEVVARFDNEVSGVEGAGAE